MKDLVNVIVISKQSAKFGSCLLGSLCANIFTKGMNALISVWEYNDIHIDRYYDMNALRVDEWARS